MQVTVPNWKSYVLNQRGGGREHVFGADPISVCAPLPVGTLCLLNQWLDCYQTLMHISL